MEDSVILQITECLKLKVMLDIGFIILIIGSVMLIWLKVGVKEETKALSPRPLLLRTSAVETIKTSRRRGYRESYVLIAIGALIILICGVVN